MKYTHLYTGPDRKSYFEAVEVAMEKDSKGDLRSANLTAAAINFKVSFEHSTYEWHPAPRRQFAITIEGEVDIVASGGSTRRFGPGDVLLVDDTTGQGHMSRVVGHQTTAMFIPLETK